MSAGSSLPADSPPTFEAVRWVSFQLQFRVSLDHWLRRTERRRQRAERAREREKERELAESGISFESVRSESRSSRHYQVEKRWEMVKLVYQLTRDPQVGLSKINGSISFRVPRADRYNFSRVNTCSSPRGIIHWTRKGGKKKKKHLIIVPSSNQRSLKVPGMILRRDNFPFQRAIRPKPVRNLAGVDCSRWDCIIKEGTMTRSLRNFAKSDKTTKILISSCRFSKASFPKNVSLFSLVYNSNLLNSIETC